MSGALSNLNIFMQLQAGTDIFSTVHIEPVVPPDWLSTNPGHPYPDVYKVELELIYIMFGIIMF